MSVDVVSDIEPRVQYTAAAAQTAFDYPFPIFADADLVVDVDGVTQALTTDYTVTGAGDDTGGTVTFLSAMTGGEVVTIYRDIAIDRLTDFQQNGRFSSSSFNDELDKIIMIQQQLDARINRALRLPMIASATSAQAELSPIASWYGKAIKIDENGVPVPLTLTEGTVADLATRQVFTATAGQTTFTIAGGYTVGAVDVYLNGAKLVATEDFTATNGSTVVLATGATENDRIDVTAWSINPSYLPQYYGATTAEGTALVSITDYSWPPGDPRRFGAVLDGITDDQAALQAAINSSDDVYIPSGTLRIGSAVNLRTGVTVRGDGFTSIIKASANSFSLLTDNNTALSNVSIRDIAFQAVSVGSANRGILFDADTASLSTNVTIERCKFTTLFRGIEVDRVLNLKIRDCVFSSLSDIGVYVGQSVAAGRSERVSITGCTFNDCGGADIGGGTTVSYADDVEVTGNHFDTVGATSGSTNLYHGVYLRWVTNGAVANNTFRDSRRGAAIHIYSDVVGGETAGSNISVTGNVINGTNTYVGIRCSYVNDLSITGNTVRNCNQNGAYISNINGLTLSGNLFHENNEAATTGMAAAAAVRIDDVLYFTITGNTAREATAVDGDYAQTGFVIFEDACADGTVSGNTFFCSADATSVYYFAEVSTGDTLDRVTFSGNVQNGASRFFNEAGTATDCTFIGNLVSGNGSAQFLTVAQLHKFSAKGNFNQGAPVVYESDGTYVTARLSAAPGSDAWVVGDIVWDTNAASAAPPGWYCTAAGTPGTWTAMANLA